MSWQRFFGKVYEIGGDATIAGTQFLSKRKWVRLPNETSTTLGSGAFRYRIVRDWCKADRQRLSVNNCHEMVMDSQQRLYLLTDTPKNNVIIFDLDGRVIDSWTLHSKSAHGLTIVSESEGEFLWICSPYSGEVLKTTLQGRVVKTLSGAHHLGVYKKTMPYMPTQTAVAPNGDIYVADGYGSQHVLQFDAAGNFIRLFAGKANGAASLDFAHGIAIDNRGGYGKESLLITSRREGCIKRFDLKGNYLGVIQLPGGFPCRPVVYGENLLISLCWSGKHLRPNSGFVVILDHHNAICATLGGQLEVDGKGMRALVSDYSCFRHVHDVCPDKDGNLYICEWNAGGKYPLKLERM